MKKTKCKIWDGTIRNGYGVIYICNGYVKGYYKFIEGYLKRHYKYKYIYGNFSGQYPLHRFVYEQVYGKLPRSIAVHHICQVKICYRLVHLKAVNHKEHAILHSPIFDEKIADRFLSNLLELRK